MIVILTGKSGSGKNTVSEYLQKNMGYERIVTYTTRPPRDGETEKDYHFVSDNEFNRMIKNDRFAEHKAYHPATGGTWQYGSVFTDEEINSRKPYIIILTPTGLQDVKKNIPEKNMKSIYLHCTTKALKSRLVHRGDDPKEIVRRLNADNRDFKGVQNDVDRVIFCSNKSVKEIADEIDEFIKEKLKSQKSLCDMPLSERLEAGRISVENSRGNEISADDKGILR